MSTKNRTLALAHKADFRQRLKFGMVRVVKPWDWISAADVKALASKAYRVASFGFVEDVQGDALSDQEMRQAFACELAELISDFVMAQAVTKGGCWPITPETPPFCNYPRIVANRCATLPPTWRPQYPLFKPKTLPAGGIGGNAPDVAAKRRGGIKGLAC